MGFQLPTSTGEFTGFQNHQQYDFHREKKIGPSGDLGEGGVGRVCHPQASLQ